MSNDRLFYKMIKRKHPLLIEFYQERCKSCQTMDAILKIVNQRSMERYKIIQLNLNAFPEIAALYNIKEVPTCMLFENEKLKWRESGILSSKKLITLFEDAGKNELIKNDV